jgi:D-alanine-D-alanine ligase
MLIAHDIPTPAYKFIKDMRSKIPADLGLPLIIKLNESGGSVGIDNKAVKETVEAATKKIAKMLEAYKIPVIAEQFIDGPEITAVAYDDGHKKHVLLAQKSISSQTRWQTRFTSLESYEDVKSYYYKIPEQDVIDRITPLVLRAFETLDYRDYAKFDIRYNEETKTAYFIDCNQIRL